MTAYNPQLSSIEGWNHWTNARWSFSTLTQNPNTYQESHLRQDDDTSNDAMIARMLGEEEEEEEFDIKDPDFLEWALENLHLRDGLEEDEYEMPDRLTIRPFDHTLQRFTSPVRSLVSMWDETSIHDHDDASTLSSSISSLRSSIHPAAPIFRTLPSTAIETTLTETVPLQSHLQPQTDEDEEEERICPICHDDLTINPHFDDDNEDGSNVDIRNSSSTLIPEKTFCPACANGFHKTCMAFWFQQDRPFRVCPMCRTPADDEFVQSVLWDRNGSSSEMTVFETILAR